MLGQVTNAGLFSGGVTQLSGIIELQASIDPISHVHHGATLLVGAPTLDLLGFAGQVQLDDATDLIDGAAGTTLISDANTISGSGQIGTGQLDFTNLSFDSVVNATGTLVINGPTTTNNGTLQVSPGGELDIDGAVAGSGVMTVNSGVLTLGGTVAAGQTIEFAAGFVSHETLALGDPLAMAGSINSLFGGVGRFDTIDLLNTAATSVNSSGGTLTVMNGSQTVASLLLQSSFHYTVVPDNATGTFVVVACFAAGTRILTARGEVAVEALRVGDAVATVRRGKLARVQWLGHRHLDCRRHPDPRAVWPIRVQAGAFGPATPHADLLLSPDHAVFVDGAGAAPGVLIPIRYLVNGRSIAQEARDEVTYWHVELPCHDILLAEGLPAESYLDTGNRDAFADNAGSTRLHADFALRIWEAQGCAPLVAAGTRLATVKARLLAHATALGHAMTGDAALRLLVDGHVLRPRTIDGLCRFRLPAAARDVRLLSRSATPAHTYGDGSDERCLGVAVSRLVLDGRPIALDDPRLGSGWHDVECNGAGLPGWRWTNGDAALAVTGPGELDIEVAVTVRYWAEPPPAVATPAGALL
jgi:hypothetical protein